MSDQSPGSELSPSPPAEKRPKIAIPRQVHSNGPMQRIVQLPPRARPGRKPLSGDTNDKRKDQNRNAQRAFRDRRAQRVFDLEQENAQLKAAHSNEIAHKDDMISQLQTGLSQQDNENSRLKAENAQLQAEIAQLKADVSQQDHMISRVEGSQSVLLTLPANPQAVSFPDYPEPLPAPEFSYFP